MHAIILEGISHHGLNFKMLNSYLFQFNQEIYEMISEKAISYYDTYATEKIKSCGN